MRWRIAPTSEYRLWVQRLIWAAFWLVTRVIRTDVAGAIPEPPCIVVSNHLHYLDIPLAGRFAIRFGERVHWLAKSELFRIPLIGAVLRAMQTVEIHRGSADRQALEQMIAYARTGKVWIFPEGHRSADGLLQEGKEGVTLVARRAGVPIVPIGISGTEAGALPLLLRRATFRLRMGEPFRLPAGLSREAATRHVMAAIEAQLPHERLRG